MKRRRILLSCFYFSPYRGSEAGVGWRVATGLAAKYDVTVLCGDFTPQGITAGDLRKYREAGGEFPPGLEVHEIRADECAQALHRIHALPGMWAFYYLAYARWQRQALKLAQELHARLPFELAHHVNIIGFREPGYLWQLGIPWFWGPIAGASMIPWPYLALMSRAEKFRWGSRNILNAWQIRTNRRCCEAACHARHIWAVTPEDCRMVTDAWGCKVEPMLETGASLVEGVTPRMLARGETLKLVWSGLFQGRKALPLVLEALGTLKDRKWTLSILGNGPEAQSWKDIARTIDVADRIEWCGMLPRDGALEVMRDSHVLLHSSLKEGTPHVVLEALALGVPVICHDACGMGTAVTDSCGIKIPMINPRVSVAGFRQALQRVLDEPELVERLSRGAIQRASELSWQSNMDRYSRAYETLWAD